MKKKILFVLFILLSLFILYAAFVSHIYHKEIKINASVQLIHQEISSLDKIARWFMPFASADTGTDKIIKQEKLEFDNTVLKITNITGYSTTYQVAENKKSETILYDVMPDTGHYSKVILTYKTTLWKELFNSGKTVQNAKKSLEDGKDAFKLGKQEYDIVLEGYVGKNKYYPVSRKDYQRAGDIYWKQAQPLLAKAQDFNPNNAACKAC